MPFFSVVIPLYNKEPFIAKTLEAALAQTFTDFEIIIVNDGSTDNSEAFIKQFSNSNIRYTATHNRGVSAARNTAINMAQGKLIAFLDADDYWMPNHLETLYDLYNTYPEAGIVASRHYIKNPGQTNLQKPVFDAIPDDYKGIVTDFFGSSLTNRIAWTSSLAIPKVIFATTGTFNENITHGEDTEMWIRIGIKYPVALGNIYTAVYNLEPPGSLSKRKMADRKIMDFHPFVVHEETNSSLKAFLDMYRIEYALKYRIEGDAENSKKLYNTSSPGNIHFKTRILFNTPPFILRLLLKTKHWLHKNGINFTVYN